MRNSARVCPPMFSPARPSPVRRFAVRGLALALTTAVAVAAAGCSADDEPGPSGGPPPAGAPTGSSAAAPSPVVEDWGDPAPAAAGGRSATACGDLPVTFDLPAKWAPAAIDADTAAAFGGPDRVACEVDAKPAGILGFIRVYLATTTDARKAVTERVARSGVPKDQKFRPVTTPAGAGVEVFYVGEGRTVRAFAVPAGSGTVVVEWGGSDEDEHRSGLPAYVLVRTTLARS